MLIKEIEKQRSRNSKSFCPFVLAQTSRLNEKGKQRALFYLGFDPPLRDKHSSITVLDILESKVHNKSEQFSVNPSKQLLQLANRDYEKYRPNYPEEAPGGASVFSTLKNDDFKAQQPVNKMKTMLRGTGVDYGRENDVRIMSAREFVGLKLPVKTKIIRKACSYHKFRKENQRRDRMYKLYSRH